MITQKDIRNGFNTELIRLIVDPNMESGTVCQIGDSWFYFGGLTAEESSPEEYLRSVPMDDIVREIFETLEDFRFDECFREEYAYYEAVLSITKVGSMKNINYNKLLWDILKEHKGHNVQIVSYGDCDEPANVALECEDCGAVILDAEIYTICAREDI